jgi:hypothetical protein
LSAVRGHLYPSLSRETGDLQLDGSIHITTSSGGVYEFRLVNHRGYRLTSRSGSMDTEQTAIKCMNPFDLPPLHDWHSVVNSAVVIADNRTQPFQHVHCQADHTSSRRVLYPFNRATVVVC